MNISLTIMINELCPKIVVPLDQNIYRRKYSQVVDKIKFDSFLLASQEENI